MRAAGVALILLLCAPLGVAWAAEAELIIDQVDVTGHPEVVVWVTPPAGIGGQSDLAFSITERGETRDVVFELAGSEDLQVLLLIDTSGSMAGEPISAARQAASSFLDRMPDQAEVGVAVFGSESMVSAPLSLDRRAASAALDDLAASGETALYDGVITASEQFGSDGRRAVVLLSDGGDTVSTASLEEATARLLDTGIQLHVVELQSPESDSAALQQLANAGGGSVVPVTDPTALAQVYEDIASQLVHRYRLTYPSAAHGLTPLEIRASSGSSAAVSTFEVAFPLLPDVVPPVEEEPQPEPPVLRAGELIEVVGLRSPWALYVGAAIIYVGLAIGLVVVLSPAEKRPRLLAGRKSQVRGSSAGLLSEFADRATSFVERGMEERGGGGALNRLLEQAGVLLRPAEFVVFVGSVSIGVFLLGWVWADPMAAVVLAFAVVVGARMILGVLRSRREEAFANQLDDSLQLLAGSLRAGYGILQAIDSLSREAERPTADEFRRVVLEARLGRDFHESLHAMADRLESVDFKWVVDAIQIHGEVGGDLGEVLDNVGETIRDRNQVRRQIEALSAEGKLSAIILLILPFAVGILISFIVPGYLQELFTHPVGIAMLVMGSILMVIGAFWIRKIVKVVF